VNEAVQVGLIGFAGAVFGALITAFVQPLWSNFVSKRAKLFVEIRHWRFRLPRYLKDQIDEYIYNYRAQIRPSSQTKDRLRDISSSEGLTEVAIHNRSKRSIEGLVLHLEKNRDFIADLTVDGEKKPSAFGKVCTIGTLRAGGSCQVTLWTSTESTARWSAYDSIIVAANEYDRISVKYPATDYISRTYFLIARKLFWTAFWIFLVVFDLLIFVLPLFYKFGR